MKDNFGKAEDVQWGFERVTGVGEGEGFIGAEVAGEAVGGRAAAPAEGVGEAVGGVGEEGISGWRLEIGNWELGMEGFLSKKNF